MTAYLSLFVWSFLAASLVPVASEPLLIALVLQRNEVALPVAIASLGNYLGAVTTYLLGGVLASLIAPRWRTPAGPAAARIMRRYGPLALVLSWVPIIGDGIVAAAGATAVPFLQFSVWALTGKVAQYLVVAWVATRFR